MIARARIGGHNINSWFHRVTSQESTAVRKLRKLLKLGKEWRTEQVTTPLFKVTVHSTEHIYMNSVCIAKPLGLKIVHFQKTRKHSEESNRDSQKCGVISIWRTTGRQNISACGRDLGGIWQLCKIMSDMERLDRDRWSFQGSPVNKTRENHVQNNQEGTGYHNPGIPYWSNLWMQKNLHGFKERSDK